MLYHCDRKGWVVLKVPGKDIYWRSNRTENVFSQMGHGVLVGRSSNLDFLMMFCELKDQYFGFIGHRRSEERNDPNDVVKDIFEQLSSFDWWVNRNGLVVLLGKPEVIARVVVGYRPEGSEIVDLMSEVGEHLCGAVPPDVGTGTGAA